MFILVSGNEHIPCDREIIVGKCKVGKSVICFLCETWIQVMHRSTFVKLESRIIDLNLSRKLSHLSKLPKVESRQVDLRSTTMTGTKDWTHWYQVQQDWVRSRPVPQPCNRELPGKKLHQESFSSMDCLQFLVSNSHNFAMELLTSDKSLLETLPYYGRCHLVLSQLLKIGESTWDDAHLLGLHIH